ncbi:hypothetical protein IGI04_006118 [Brassica rapa subsp. trilocularis]|uniref:Uncharacterized protein n=1 Tax=Brassica rapa subsp. trilocularis TaxID=1813537 RepID=A0ABQ7NJ64_BRACM|nr:hypothetical protein IGI04_006118 [Brassica rapa subsp. trilocularis]
MAIEEGCVKFSCGCGLESCLVLGVQSRFVGVISGGCLIFDGQSLRNHEVPKSFYGKELVRMRRVESPLKVQWRVEVGIEECVQLRLRILTSLDSVYVLRVLIVIEFPVVLCVVLERVSLMEALLDTTLKLS